mmetsp:Transcript_40464/g.122410  ORF Transcript_40464/g.122410 Transcript_40464/m.122410 type:complete len:207 (-) Transcript_40464:9-629(-)
MASGTVSCHRIYNVPPSAHSSSLGPSLAHVEGRAPAARTATAAEAMGAQREVCRLGVRRARSSEEGRALATYMVKFQHERASSQMYRPPRFSMYTECSSATSVVMPSVSEPESAWTSHLHVPCHWRILNCIVPSRSTRHDSGQAARRTHPDLAARSAAKAASMARCSRRWRRRSFRRAVVPVSAVVGQSASSWGGAIAQPTAKEVS